MRRSWRHEHPAISGIGCDAFEITGCWATVLAKGAVHKVHSHPNNFLSGVYYVRTRPGADTINLVSISVMLFRCIIAATFPWNP